MNISTNSADEENYEKINSVYSENIDLRYITITTEMNAYEKKLNRK